jgi:hypothetical protein
VSSTEHPVGSTRLPSGLVWLLDTSTSPGHELSPGLWGADASGLQGQWFISSSPSKALGLLKDINLATAPSPVIIIPPHTDLSSHKRELQQTSVARRPPGTAGFL